MSNNNGASNNLRAFLGQIWGGISFVVGVVTSLLGWIQVAKGDLGLFTLILLSVGISALFLACVYYVWFWKPELEDESTRILIPDSDKAIKIQRVKQQRRKKVRLLARLGLFVIPLLTVAGFSSWYYYRSLPTQDFIILVAKFDGPKPQEYRVTETIIENLENATEGYSHVKIETLETSLNKSNARKEGKQQKAAIVIWGWYGKTEEKVPISVNFELLNSSPKLPKLGHEARGQVQTLAVAQLESFKLQTRLSQEMTYLSLFTLGMYRYLEKDWDKAIEHFSKALGTLESAEEPVTALGKEVVYFYRGTSYLGNYLGKNYLQAIDDYSIYINNIIFGNEKNLPAIVNIGLIQYEQGLQDEAMRQWQQAVKIDPNSPEPKLALAVTLYVRGEQEKAFKMAEAALKLDKQFAELEYLKENLWGKRLLADAEKLLSTPKIQRILFDIQENR